MKIRLIGAAGGEVTGSCYSVQTKGGARTMIDCGLFQGGKKSESLNRPPASPNQRLDTVLLTHGHLDHTGRLPLLAKMGYTGKVFGTSATLDMAALILRDSARLQMADNERQNRKRVRAGQPPTEPLYTTDDAEAIIKRFRPAPYQELFQVGSGVKAIWAESGHMLGSASIQLLVEEDGKTKRIVFSGDLGPRSAPMLREFEPFKQADVLFLESTYGGRDHRSFAETVVEFERIVIETAKAGGKMLVPTFAVGRAQLITLLLGKMFRAGKVKPFPIFLDSPMAIQATEIYVKHLELFDDEMKAYIRQRPLREDLKTLKPTPTAEDSRAINNVRGTCLIMAGAGMCNGGRILHHLKANLWKPDTHVLIVGYQGYGSLGRRLVDGDKEVRIFGEKIAVKAKIHTLGGFSAHAGRTDLLYWFSIIAPSKPRVILVHGEDDQRAALARAIQQRYRIPSTLPKMGDTVEF
jgi:metallo-beta-lactamase family protein